MIRACTFSIHNLTCIPYPRYSFESTVTIPSDTSKSMECHASPHEASIIIGDRTALRDNIYRTAGC